MSTPPLVDNRKDDSGNIITYKTVALRDGNIWLAENFNYYIDANWPGICQSFRGDGTDLESRREAGLYYEWEAFSKNIIPPGWHLPTIDEWKNLINHYGGFDGDAAYHALVKGGSSGLNLGIYGGTYYRNQSCNQLAVNNGWVWSASEGDDRRYAALINLQKREQKIQIQYQDKERRFNARLVKDK